MVVVIADGQLRRVSAAGRVSHLIQAVQLLCSVGRLWGSGTFVSVGVVEYGARASGGERQPAVHARHGQRVAVVGVAVVVVVVAVAVAAAAAVPGAVAGGAMPTTTSASTSTASIASSPVSPSLACFFFLANTACARVSWGGGTGCVCSARGGGWRGDLLTISRGKLRSGLARLPRRLSRHSESNHDKRVRQCVPSGQGAHSCQAGPG